MLDLVKGETERIDSRFLEPACGSGNFLVPVLQRKLAAVEAKYGKSDFERRHYALLAASCTLTPRTLWATTRSRHSSYISAESGSTAEYRSSVLRWLVRARNADPESVLVRWPRTDVPKLSDVLRRDAELAIPPV